MMGGSYILTDSGNINAMLSFRELTVPSMTIFGLSAMPSSLY